jgi:hypothetical protein
VTPWLVSRRFDLTFLFGGAAVGLLAAAAALAFPGAIVLIWWGWTLVSDGPHMMAAYTRTYLDPEARKLRPKLLWGSLACFALGPACLLANVLTGSDGPFLLFLGAVTAYGYNHLVRQHYGFLALYKAKAGERSRAGFWLDKWCLYVGCWVPYVYFLVTHPSARALLGLAVAPPAWIGWLLGGAFAAAVLVLFGHSIRTGSRLPKLAYAALALGLHGGAYFALGRFEPVYAQSTGPDQDFLMLTVLLSTFHNVQYMALVYIHNRSRYGGGEHAAASWLARRLGRYLLVLGGFSLLLYLPLAASTGVFPHLQSFVGTHLGPFSVNQLFLALYWGIAVHHYVVDQYIWRIKDDPELRRHLGLALPIEIKTSS